MRGLILTVSTIFLVAGTQIVMNLQPEAEITIEALSHYELHELGWTTGPSSGLKVVGVGELVYLSGADALGEDVTSYAWSMTPAPTSTSTLDSVGTQWNTFRPDVQGDYTINLTVTTASGTSDASIVVTAATYTGVEAGQCGTCHFNTKNDWVNTGHSDMFTLAIDGIKSSNYNEACIECHTVGYNTDPTADNGGFDDVQALLGWVFPDTLQAGNWDDIVTNFPDLAAKANIQCESCHGPASQHSPFATDDNNRMGVSLDEGVCGRCHEEEPYHRRNIQWKESAHAQGASFARGTRSTCAPCHSGWGFIDRHQDKSTGGKFWSEDLPPQVISCAACHDPHMSREPGDHQLRTIADFTLVNGVTVSKGGTGKLCMNCHQARREANEYVTAFSGGTFRGAHHSVQTDVLFGQNAFTFGRVLPNSTHKDALENTCASCHMYETPESGDPARDKIGDHTFAVSWVDGAGVQIDNTAACERCHGVFDSFAEFMARDDDDGDGTVEPIQEEIHGLLEQVEMLLPPFGTTDILPGDDPFWADPENLLYRKGFWNYLMMEEEGSFGVHNYQFSVAVLKLTAQALEFGVLDAGMIMGIEDVPNDQGRQVGVAWNRFGGDGPSDTPLQDYYVWRKVEDPAAMGKMTQTALKSFKDVPVATEETEVSLSSLAVVFDGELWTAVGHQPAAAMPIYSAVVPTLGDATETDTVWSTFVVSGHVAGAPDMTVVTEPATGYSVDNLVPTAPTMSAVGTKRKVELAFELDREELRNTDFDYFAIYRSTESGFDPAGMEPLATTAEDAYRDTDVVYNTTYYYRAAAFDFNGNQGEFSDEVMGAVGVGVDDTGEIPVDFALHQNYPNPFNPSTTIAFDVPRASDVSVRVYDLLGRQVHTLVDGSLPAGKHRVMFNAEGMSSGLYVVRFETPDGAFERTIMLIK